MRKISLYILAILLSTFCEEVHAQSNFKLTDTLLLNEVIIRNTSKVYQKGDTTIYNADSFNTHKNTVLEDILKRMPGIDVLSNGVIKSDGKPVNRIFINGNEVDLIDIRTLSKNLPAEIIATVQTMDLYSEAAQISGIKDGNKERIINLKLKDNINGGLYGRASGGYGTNDRFGLNNFANYMREGMMLSSIATLTNANGANLDVDGESSGSSSGGNQANTKQKSANLNYAYQVSPNIKLNGTYDFAGKTNFLEEQKKRITFLPSGHDYLQSSFSNGLNEVLSHKLVSRLTWKPNKTATFSAYISLNSTQTEVNKNTLDTSYLDSNSMLSRKIDIANLSKRQNVASSISFQNRWNSKRAIYLKWDFRNNQHNNQSNNSYQYNEYKSTQIVRNELRQKGVEYNNAFQIQYSEKLSKKNTISIDYNFANEQGEDKKHVFLPDSLDNIYLDKLQSYNNTASFEKQTANLKYQYEFNRSSYVLGMAWQALNRKYNNSVENAQKISDFRMALLPIASIKYRLSSKEMIECNYSGVMSAPDLQSLQPAPDYRDSINIFIGNPNLKPEKINNFQTIYSLMNLAKNSTLRASISYQWIYNKIVNEINVNDNKTYLRPINLNGNYTVGMSINYGTSLSKKVRLIGTLNGNNNNNVTISNGSLQSLNSLLINPGLKSILSFDVINLDVSYNYSTSFLQPETKNLVSTHTFECDARLKFPMNFTLQSNLSFVLVPIISDQFEQKYYFFSASLEKEFAKVPGLFLKASVNDIFNNNSNYRRVVGGNYIEESTYNVLGRYGMISVIYRYNYFR